MFNLFKRRASLPVLESTRKGGNALRRGDLSIPLTAHAEHAILNAIVHGRRSKFTDQSGEAWSVTPLRAGGLELSAYTALRRMTLSAAEANTLAEALKDEVRGQVPPPMRRL